GLGRYHECRSGDGWRRRCARVRHWVGGHRGAGASHSWHRRRPGLRSVLDDRRGAGVRGHGAPTARPPPRRHHRRDHPSPRHLARQRDQAPEHHPRAQQAIMSRQLDIKRGTHGAWDIPFSRGGAPLDLTGYTLTFQARRQSTDADALITKTLTVADPTTGIATLQLDAEDTPFATFNKSHPERLVYGIEIVAPDGWTEEFVGTLTVLPDAVR